MKWGVVDRGKSKLDHAQKRQCVISKTPSRSVHPQVWESKPVRWSHHVVSTAYLPNSICEHPVAVLHRIGFSDKCHCHSVTECQVHIVKFR
jgi:hypothetical protein